MSSELGTLSATPIATSIGSRSPPRAANFPRRRSNGAPRRRRSDRHHSAAAAGRPADRGAARRRPADHRSPTPNCATLSAIGYTVRRSSGVDERRHCRVMRQLDEDDHDFIERGGRGLLLADEADALGGGFGDFPPVALGAWDVALFDGGEWVSAFSWLRRSDGSPISPVGRSSTSGSRGSPAGGDHRDSPARFEYDVLRRRLRRLGAPGRGPRRPSPCRAR